MKDATHEFRIIDIRQSRKPSYIRSIATTLLIFAALFGPGIAADSSAMQWAGFAMLILYIMVFLVGFNAKRMTIAEARAELDKLEKEETA